MQVAKAMMRRFAIKIGAVSFAMLTFCTPVFAQKLENDVAVLAGLDKITGRIIRFDVHVNETVQFGSLQIRPRVCYTRPTTETPQTTGFIEVDEVTLNRKVQPLFRGWMFAASPGLHAVEHPVYDVWLADCKSADEFSAVPVAPRNDELGGRGFDDTAEAELAKKNTPIPRGNPIR